MDSLDIIGILLGAVAGMAHVSDHIPGSDHAAFLQIQRIGEILTQVSVIVVAFAVKASDTDPPAAVLVPAEGLHVAGFHGDDGRADRDKISFTQTYCSKRDGTYAIPFYYNKIDSFNLESISCAVSLLPPLMWYIHLQ